MDYKYIIDFSTVEKVCKSSNIQLSHMLDTFLISSQRDYNEFLEALNLRDITQVGRASHSMKSTYSYFRDCGISDVMERIEKASYNNECFDNLELYFEAVKSKINYIENEVKERLQELGEIYE